MLDDFCALYQQIMYSVVDPIELGAQGRQTAGSPAILGRPIAVTSNARAANSAAAVRPASIGGRIISC